MSLNDFDKGEARVPRAKTLKSWIKDPNSNSKMDYTKSTKAMFVSSVSTSASWLNEEDGKYKHIWLSFFRNIVSQKIEF